MKRTKWIKHRARARRYKKPVYWQRHKSYGSKLFRDIIKEKISLKQENKPLFYTKLFNGEYAIGLPSQQQEKEIIKTIEKNPDLLKPLKKKDIFVFENIGKNKKYAFLSDRGDIFISKEAFDRSQTDFDPITESNILVTPEAALKHEIAHARQIRLGGRVVGKNKPFMEVAPDYAIHTNIRKEKVPKQLLEKYIKNYFEKEDLL